MWLLEHPQFGSFGGGRPKVTNQSMRLSEGEPCGEECFRLTDESYMVTAVAEHPTTFIPDPCGL